MRLAYIGMGGNLPSWAGRPEATLTEAAKHLGRLGRVIRRSSLYSTIPVGIADQPRFVNAVVELETDLAPQQLLSGLMAIEHEFGRDRSTAIRNGPRTLDLDILLYGDRSVSEPGLEIPHPRLAERAFALVPLSGIAPSLIHPVSGQTVQQLLQSLTLGKENDDDAPIPTPWNDWPVGARSGSVDGRTATRVPASGEPESYGGR